jgi:isohexenylglutaconyl-CoA hydratase
MPETILIEHRAPFVAITLNRPDARNAMSQQMVVELREAFDALRDDRSIRAIVLSGAGGTFCAGGDIKEMQSAFTNPENDDSDRTAQFDGLLQAVQTAPQVVVAKVDGAAMGGGFGLVCVSDVAIAGESALFGLPEVRLGLVPALISPYVIDRIGLTTARKLMLTGARFGGADAFRYGLVHEVCTADELDERVNAVLEDVRQASPHALAACKALIFRVNRADIATTTAYRAQTLDDLRRGESGQEGMMAFIQKRKPSWAEE